MLLYRLASPSESRLVDMMQVFGVSRSYISSIVNDLATYLYYTLKRWLKYCQNSVSDTADRYRSLSPTHKRISFNFSSGIDSFAFLFLLCFLFGLLFCVLFGRNLGRVLLLRGCSRLDCTLSGVCDHLNVED
ncbi:hypothetical protein EV426DRAFT_614442 [Tirmania nivea]|nr:hypothetical protein EV426DRAFT_614442 [Tirmania nivea]